MIERDNKTLWKHEKLLKRVSICQKTLASVKATLEQGVTIVVNLKSLKQSLRLR